MGKLKNNLERQLSTENSSDAEKCLKLYNILLENTGKVSEMLWNGLTDIEFIGRYPKCKRIYKLNRLGEIMVLNAVNNINIVK